MPVTPTVLQRIVAELKTRLAGMQTDDDPPTQLWNNVRQGTLQDISAVASPVVSLEQGPEVTTENLFPQETKVVTFFVEFQFRRLMELDNHDTFRYYLGKLQQRLFGGVDNKTLGGLCINVLESDNNPQIEGQSDANPGGLLTFQVHYRIVQGNPYQLPSEATSYG